MREAPGQSEVLVVIPLYNHGATVAQVAARALAAGFAVLVVDDGSTDGGINNLPAACATLRRRVNEGKGAAITAACVWAAGRGYQAIITIDADGQHDPADAPLLVRKAAESWPCVVIGDRDMAQSNVPGASRFGRKFSNFWVRLECGIEVVDSQSGFRLYPVAELLATACTSRRYDYEIEVLVRLCWAGLPVCSTPVSVHYPPGEERVSHFDKWRDNIRLSWLHTRLVCRRLLPLPYKRLLPERERGDEVIEIRHPLRTLKKLCRESSSPFWLAVAVWFGLFLGALPLIACHTIVIIYVAYRFRLNKIAAVAASQFCMPPVVPVLCIEVGHFLLHGRLLLEPGYDRWLFEIHHRLWEWLLGSLLLGPLLGVAGGAAVYWGALFLRRRSGL